MSISKSGINIGHRNLLTITILSFISIMLFTAPIAYANETAADVAAAMDVSSPDLVSADLGTSDHAGAAILSTPAVGFPTQGTNYAVLSSGCADDALSPNTSGSNSCALSGLNTALGRDMTQLKLVLNVPSGATSVAFDWKFFSDEFPEFVGSSFSDAFLVELGGAGFTSTFTISGTTITAPANIVFDSIGNLITINTVGPLGMTAAAAAGTIYDGATPLLTTSAPIPTGATTITLIFSVFDLGDDGYDTTAFIDNFRFTDATGAPVTVITPPTTTISIDSTNPTTLKWGNSVTVSGSTSGSSTVTVTWGDGATSTLIPILGGSWGPVSHTYDATAVGTNNIVATLRDGSNNVLATSASSPVTVDPHMTSLSAPTLSAPSVKWGGTYQVLATSGSTLIDLDAASATIPGKTISFSGSAVTGTPSGTTVASLIAPVDVVSPGAGNVGLATVTGTFAGDSAYVTSTSPAATIEITKHVTSLSAPTLSAPSVKWDYTFKVLATPGSTLTDLDAAGGPVAVAGKTIAFSGTAVTGTPTGTTIASLTADVDIIASTDTGTGKTVIGTFAPLDDDPDYLTSTSPAATIEITKHTTSGSISLSPTSTPWGRTFDATFALTDDDSVPTPSAPVLGKPIVYSGPDVSAPVPAATSGSAATLTATQNTEPPAGEDGVTGTFSEDSLYLGTSAVADETILKHITTLLVVASPTVVPWELPFTATSTLTDSDSLPPGTTVSPKPISYSGSGVLSPPIAGSTGANTLTASHDIGTGKEVIGTFAEDSLYLGSSDTTTIEIRKHITSLSLNGMADKVEGETVAASGSSLVDNDLGGIGIDGKSIALTETKLPSTILSSLATPVTTNGIKITDPAGITINTCSSPTCTPNLGSGLSTVKVVHLSTGGSIEFPLGALADPSTRGVSLTLQDMGTNPYKIKITFDDGNSVEDSGAATFPDNLVITATGNVKKIEVLESTLGVGFAFSNVKIIETSGPHTLMDVNFDSLSLPSPLPTSITVDAGALFSLGVATPTDGVETVQVDATFSPLDDDPDYFTSTSFPVTYTVVADPNEAQGVGGSSAYSAAPHQLNVFRSAACTDADPDTDGDSICDSWEATGGSALGIPYGVTFDGATTTYYYPPPADTDAATKDILVEIDHMTGHSPDDTAISNVITNFEGASPTINLHVSYGASADEIPHATILSAWADSNYDTTNDFDALKAKLFGSASERPSVTAGGTYSISGAGAAASRTVTISGVTVSVPAEPTQVIVTMKSRITLSSSGAVVTLTPALISSLPVAPSGVSWVSLNPTLPSSGGTRVVTTTFQFSTDGTATSVELPDLTFVAAVPSPATVNSLFADAAARTGETSVTSTKMQARAQVYHYGIFAHGLISCGAAGGPSGVGEQPGNDFIVSLGCGFHGDSDGFDGTRGTINEQASTFMHELGHNLNLNHGGPKTIAGSTVLDAAQNCKPNYFSIMSYSRQMDTSGYLSEADWSLGFSKGDFKDTGPITENNLNEDAGLVSANANTPTTVWAVPVAGAAPIIKTGPTTAAGEAANALNWDNSAVVGGTSANTDINNFKIPGCGVSATPFTISPYKDYDDYANLKYNFRGSDGQAFSSIHAAPKSTPEITGETLTITQNSANSLIFNPPVDIDGSSTFKLGSTAPFKFQWFTPELVPKFVSGQKVTMVVTRLPNDYPTECNTGVITEPLLTISDATSAGSLFKELDNQYHFNLDTSTLKSLGGAGKYAASYVKDYDPTTKDGILLGHKDFTYQIKKSDGSTGEFTLPFCVRK